MFPFGKLHVWQPAIGSAEKVCHTTQQFPDGERFNLTGQMRRAAVSIAYNIAEGSARYSKKDFARFIEIAIGSLFEVVAHSTIGRRQDFLSQEPYRELYRTAETQGRLLSELRRPLTHF